MIDASSGRASRFGGASRVSLGKTGAAAAAATWAVMQFPEPDHRTIARRGHIAFLLKLTILLMPLLAVAACASHRPNFISRVREDSATGDRWAGDLLGQPRISEALAANRLITPAAMLCSSSPTALA